jgi:hypothetical protein
MLMTRFAYLCFMVLILSLNGAALWAVFQAAPPIEAIVPAAFIVNLASWPLALIIAYRVGQVTGQEYLRKARTKDSAIHATGRVSEMRRAAVRFGNEGTHRTRLRFVEKV